MHKVFASFAFVAPLLVFAPFVTLSACGGGGGGSSSSGGSVGSGGGGGTPPVAVLPLFTSASSASLIENNTDGFYVLAVSDNAGGTLASVALSPLDDGQYFTLDPLTFALSSTLGLNFEVPADQDGDNVYTLNFTATNSAGGQGSFALNVTITDETGEGFIYGLDPSLSPSENFELDDWKLQLPINDDGNFNNDTGTSDQIEEYDLDDNCSRYTASSSVNGIQELGDAADYSGCENRFFYTGTDGGMVITAPPQGATTSSGTIYTRTELREMLRRGDRSISTNGNNDVPNGNNWAFASAPQSARDSAGGVDGTLRVTMAVNKVTTTSSSDREDQVGRLIIGQIHAADDEPIRLYYRKLPGNTLGSIYAAHERSDNAPSTAIGSSICDNNDSSVYDAGDDIYCNLIGSRSDNESEPVDGIMLGQIFTYEIDVNGNIMDVSVEVDGAVVGSTQIDMSDSGYDIANDYHYFKAGVYHVNNTADVDDFAQVTIYELDNSHDGYPF